MFGKMIQTGPQTVTERTAHCLHNCGLCKTIGREYGFLPRVLLNSDIALLQEMLGCIDSAYDDSIERAFLSPNCFRLPQSADLPASFRYSAAVTLLFAEHKLKDDIRDVRGARKALNAAYGAALGSRFARARDALSAMSFPLESFDAHVTRCGDLEDAARATPPALDLLAEAHGQLCGMVARHACRLVGKPHVGDAAHAFGIAFGGMIYLCDAFEDFSDDVRTGAFNPLVAVHGPTFSPDVRAHARTLVETHLDRMRTLSEHFSGEADSRHITRRMALNIDRLFQAQGPHMTRPRAGRGLGDRYRAFIRLTQLRFSLISAEELAPVRRTLRQLAVIVPTLFSTFILGCYASPVPLANRVSIDPALLGAWKLCSPDGKNGLLGGDDTLFQRLNDSEYLVVTSRTDSAGHVTKSTAVVYPSRVGNKIFLNIPEKEGERLRYRFAQVQMRAGAVELRFMDDALFKRPDRTEPIAFDSSAELTRFVATMINDEKLLVDTPNRLCR